MQSVAQLSMESVLTTSRLQPVGAYAETTNKLRRLVPLNEPLSHTAQSWLSTEIHLSCVPSAFLLSRTGTSKARSQSLGVPRKARMKFHWRARWRGVISVERQSWSFEYRYLGYNTPRWPGFSVHELNTSVFLSGRLTTSRSWFGKICMLAEARHKIRGTIPFGNNNTRKPDRSSRWMPGN